MTVASSEISKAALLDRFPSLAKEKPSGSSHGEFLGSFVNLLTSQGRSLGAVDPCGPRATISGYPAGYEEGVVGGLRESDHVEFFKLEL